MADGSRARHKSASGRRASRKACTGSGHIPTNRSRARGDKDGCDEDEAEDAAEDAAFLDQRSSCGLRSKSSARIVMLASRSVGNFLELVVCGALADAYGGIAA